MSADRYRTLAAQLKAKAANKPNENLASEWMQLSQAYLRLAEQADQNRRADIWIEVGPKLSLTDEEALAKPALHSSTSPAPKRWS